MPGSYGKGIDLEGEMRVQKSDFDIAAAEDEIRVDQLCEKLLMHFYLQLVQDGMPPVEATALARGADYFVRDFVVAIKRRSIFDERPGIVRQFAANWYIVNTLEPNESELSAHLLGIRAFYRYLRGEKLLSAKFLKTIEEECADIAYYVRRIDSFWEIRGDGYLAWERECSLKED